MRRLRWKAQLYWWSIRTSWFRLNHIARSYVAERFCYEFLGEAWLNGWYTGIADQASGYEEGYAEGHKIGVVETLEELGYATRTEGGGIITHRDPGDETVYTETEGL